MGGTRSPHTLKRTHMPRALRGNGGSRILSRGRTHDAPTVWLAASRSPRAASAPRLGDDLRTAWRGARAGGWYGARAQNGRFDKLSAGDEEAARVRAYL